MVRRFLSLIASLAILTSTAHAEPKATLQSTGLDDLHGCEFLGDSMTLSISDGGREIVRKTYCSAYGQGSVKIVPDAQGRQYVLLEQAEGHGTNFSTTYLDVFRLGDALVEQQRVLISELAGLTSRWTYAYGVEKPRTGGLTLRMTLHLDGDGQTFVPSPKKRKIIQIDAR